MCFNLPDLTLFKQHMVYLTPFFPLEHSTAPISSHDASLISRSYSKACSPGPGIQ